MSLHKGIIILICLLNIKIQAQSGFLTNRDRVKERQLCLQEKGIDSIIERLKKSNSKGAFYQAQALGISLEEHLIQTAESMCEFSLKNIGSGKFAFELERKIIEFSKLESGIDSIKIILEPINTKWRRYKVSKKNNTYEDELLADAKAIYEDALKEFKVAFFTDQQKSKIKALSLQNDSINKVAFYLDRFHPMDRIFNSIVNKRTVGEQMLLDADFWVAFARHDFNPNYNHSQKKIVSSDNTFADYSHIKIPIKVKYPQPYKLYNWIECKAKWNGNCDGSWELKAPPGFQVCSLSYSIISKRGDYDDPEIIPSLWFNGDTESPPRFRSFKINLTSRGRKNILDKVGANISLGDVTLNLIPADYTNEDRYKCGCVMPSPPNSYDDSYKPTKMGWDTNSKLPDTYPKRDNN